MRTDYDEYAALEKQLLNDRRLTDEQRHEIKHRLDGVGFMVRPLLVASGWMLHEVYEDLKVARYDDLAALLKKLVFMQVQQHDDRFLYDEGMNIVKKLPG